MIEVELKFFIPNNYIDSIINKLLSITEFKHTCYEKTVMYDNKNKFLYKQDARLRIRDIEDLLIDKKICELSYKKPLNKEGIKIEEEYEVIVSDSTQIKNLLLKLGIVIF